MKHIDQQLGAPSTLLTGTATALSAYTTEGMIGYATDTHKFGYRDNSTWVYPSGGGVTGSGTSGNFAKWGAGNTLTDSYLQYSGTNVLVLAAGANPVTFTVGTGGGTLTLNGLTLTLQTNNMKLTGAGTTSELSLANAKFAFAGGGASCSITLPNFAMTFAGAAGKTLTLTNSLTNQGGFDGTISWSAAVTLTVAAAASVSGTNTGDVTLASPNHGLSLTNQTIAMGTPSTLTSATTNAVTTTSHTHAITAAPALVGLGTVQYQYLVTGATPFNPGWSAGYLNITAAKTLTVSASQTLTGADGKTLTLTNSLTNQGGFDGIISWSAAVTLTVAAAASVSGTNTGDVTLASPNHGLSLTNQVIAMGTPSTLTSATTNAVTTTTHTHAVTGLFGNGTVQYQYIVTGATPFAPVYSTGYLNITAAKTLTASASMTLAGADGKTLTLTNSLTNQGGYDGIISWSAAVTLTVAAAASVSGTNTGDNSANSSSMFIGTTSHALNRGTGAETLAGITLTTPVIGAATGTSLAATSFITSSGGGIGYATGAGGTISQGSTRSTTVVLNKLCGTITMFSAAQAAQAIVTFTLTNSFIAATDFVLIEHISATNGGAWQFSVVCAAGSCTITVRNVSTGSITEATPLRFVVIKAVTA